MKAELMKARERGFTLIELMIVVAIIAILTAVALPLYQEQVRKSNRQEAKATLLKIAQLQERYYATNSIYLDKTIGTLVGVPGATTVYSGEDPADVKGKFAIVQAIGAGAGCAAITCGFTLTASLNGTYTDPKCTSLTLSSTGVRSYTGTGTKQDCW